MRIPWYKYPIASISYLSFGYILQKHFYHWITIIPLCHRKKGIADQCWDDSALRGIPGGFRGQSGSLVRTGGDLHSPAGPVTMLMIEPQAQHQPSFTSSC